MAGEEKGESMQVPSPLIVTDQILKYDVNVL